MVKSIQVPPPGFDALTADEKLEYVQTLWARIAAHPETVLVPAWHREVVRERLDEYRSNPSGSRSWKETKADIESKLREIWPGSETAPGG